jgi:hypothetical protein
MARAAHKLALWLVLWLLALFQLAVSTSDFDFDIDDDFPPTDVVLSSLRAPLEVRQSPTTGFWRCNECWPDNGVTTHFFTGSPTLISASMTNELCQTTCGNLNLKYAGTRAGTDCCWCGDDAAIIKPATVAARSECDAGTVCPGDTATKCGSSTVINVCEYVPPQPAASSYWPRAEPLDTWKCDRCYRKPTPGQVLQGGLPDPPMFGFSHSNPIIMTTEKRRTFCAALGYPFAGTHFGQACYCGLAPAAGSALVDNSLCNLPCPGNTLLSGDLGETCGGGSTYTSVCENRLGINYPPAPDIEWH